MGEAQGIVIYIQRVTFVGRRREPSFSLPFHLIETKIPCNRIPIVMKSSLLNSNKKAKEVPLPCSVLYSVMKNTATLSRRQIHIRNKSNLL
jgi:hypothetical protein